MRKKSTKGKVAPHEPGAVASGQEKVGPGGELDGMVKVFESMILWGLISFIAIFLAAQFLRGEYVEALARLTGGNLPLAMIVVLAAQLTFFLAIGAANLKPSASSFPFKRLTLLTAILPLFHFTAFAAGRVRASETIEKREVLFTNVGFPASGSESFTWLALLFLFSALAVAFGFSLGKWFGVVALASWAVVGAFLIHGELDSSASGLDKITSPSQSPSSTIARTLSEPKSYQLTNSDGVIQILIQRPISNLCVDGKPPLSPKDESALTSVACTDAFALAAAGMLSDDKTELTGEGRCVFIYNNIPFGEKDRKALEAAELPEEWAVKTSSAVDPNLWALCGEDGEFTPLGQGSLIRGLVSFPIAAQSPFLQERSED